MSKDFEQAYRELAESEIPDLWDRIEAGLESRSTSEEIGIAEDIPQKKLRKRKIKLLLKGYSGIAAAVVCVAVVIPAAVLLFRIGSGSVGNGSSGAADTTEGIDLAAAPQEEEMAFDVEEAGQEAAPEEALRESESKVAEESGMGTVTEMAEEMDAGGMAEAADEDQSADAGAGSIEQKQDSDQESAKKEYALVESAPEADDISSGDFAVGTIFEHVVIKVTEVQNDFSREDEKLPGTFYTVTIKQDTSGRLTEEDELVIDVSADSSIALSKDGEFEVDLIYRGNGIFGLEECYQQMTE